MVAAASWDKLPEWLEPSCKNTIYKAFCPNPLFSLELIDGAQKQGRWQNPLWRHTQRHTLCLPVVIQHVCVCRRWRLVVRSISAPLAPEAVGSCEVPGSGTGLCFGLVLVGVLTSLVKKSWLLTSLETILVVQEARLPSQTLAPRFQTHTHTLMVLC